MEANNSSYNLLMSDKKNGLRKHDALGGIGTALTMLAEQQKQLFTFITQQQLQQKQDEADEKIDFSSITPNETLTEMLRRSVFKEMDWEELTRYGDSEDYGYELIKGWFLEKPLNERPVRFNQEKYFVFENLKGVRGWTSYGSAKVVSKIFEKMVHLCWEHLENISKKQKPRRIFRIEGNEEDGDNDPMFSKMVILNSIVSKDETTMFQQRAYLLKRLSKHLTKN